MVISEGPTQPARHAPAPQGGEDAKGVGPPPPPAFPQSAFPEGPLCQDRHEQPPSCLRVSAPRSMRLCLGLSQRDAQEMAFLPQD